MPFTQLRSQPNSQCSSKSGQGLDEQILEPVTASKPERYKGAPIRFFRQSNIIKRPSRIQNEMAMNPKSYDCQENRESQEEDITILKPVQPLREKRDIPKKQLKLKFQKRKLALTNSANSINEYRSICEKKQRCNTNKGTPVTEYPDNNYRVCFSKCVLDNMWRDDMRSCKSETQCSSGAPLGIFHGICWEKVSGKDGYCRFCS